MQVEVNKTVTGVTLELTAQEALIIRGVLGLASPHSDIKAFRDNYMVDQSVTDEEIKETMMELHTSLDV